MDDLKRRYIPLDRCFCETAIKIKCSNFIRITETIILQMLKLSFHVHTNNGLQAQKEMAYCI